MIQEETEVVGRSFEAVCCVKGVKGPSVTRLKEAWVLVQPCGNFQPVYARRINWDWIYRRVKLVRDFEGR